MLKPKYANNVDLESDIICNANDDDVVKMASFIGFPQATQHIVKHRDNKSPLHNIVIIW